MYQSDEKKPVHLEGSVRDKFLLANSKNIEKP